MAKTELKQLEEERIAIFRKSYSQIRKDELEFWKHQLLSEFTKQLIVGGVAHMEMCHKQIEEHKRKTLTDEEKA